MPTPPHSGPTPPHSDAPPGRSGPTPRPRTARQRIGDTGEAAARALLERAGLRYVAGPVRLRVGELDLVMRDGATVVFVEVRVRHGSRYGGALHSVDHAKRRRVLKAAQVWLQQRHGSGPWPACRFDLMLNQDGRWQWLRGAFDAAGW